MSSTLTAWPAATVETLPGRSTPTPRRAIFDAMRLVAAYAIIWLHTPRSATLQNWTALGRFAVPFFVVATIFFIWHGLVEKPGRDFRSFAVSRFTRIYLPFLAWSLIYLAFKAVKKLALPEEPNVFPGIDFLWTGSFYHLWFMPFILVVSLLVFPLGKRLAVRRSAELIVAEIFTLAGAILALSPAPAWLAYVTAGVFVWNALPAVFWGVALSVAFHRGTAPILQRPAAAIAGLVVAGLCTAWVWHFGRDNLAENLAGVACVVTALAPWNASWLRQVARFGPLAFGIYFSHLLFIKTAEAILTKLGGGISPLVDVAVFLVAVVGSTMLAWGLSQARCTRWLVA